MHSPLIGPFRHLSTFSLLLITAACSSGSGSTNDVDPFSGFLSINLNGTTRIEGHGQKADLTYTSLDGGIATILPDAAPIDTDILFEVEDAFLVSIILDEENREIAFGQASAGDIWDAGLYLYSINEDVEDTTAIFLVDDIELGFVYTTFGFWITGLDALEGDFGAFTVGLPTGAIPDPFETFRYDGESMGMIRFSDGAFDFTRSNVTAWGYFRSNEVEISLWGTRTMDNFANVMPEYQAFDVTGRGDISSGEFSLEVAGTTVAGRMDGVFYGPNFEEIGGTFVTTNGDDVTYIGSFGGWQVFP